MPRHTMLQPCLPASPRRPVGTCCWSSTTLSSSPSLQYVGGGGYLMHHQHGLCHVVTLHKACKCLEPPPGLQPNSHLPPLTFIPTPHPHHHPASGFYKADIFTLKAGLVLATFTLYEAPLFATLVARRLGAHVWAVVALWVLGMAVYTGGSCACYGKVCNRPVAGGRAGPTLAGTHAAHCWLMLACHQGPPFYIRCTPAAQA